MQVLEAKEHRQGMTFGWGEPRRELLDVLHAAAARQRSLRSWGAVSWSRRLLAARLPATVGRSCCWAFVCHPVLGKATAIREGLTALLHDFLPTEPGDK